MRLLLLLTAAVIAVVAGITALQWSNKKMGVPASAPAVSLTDSSPEVSTVDVLVARNAITVGSVITEEMVDKQPWPDHLVLEGFITGDAKDANILGKIARAPVQAREPIILSKLADPNEPGFLAAVLSPGMRAITLATDAVTGVAGYVFPGDRVDIVFVHNLSDQSGSSAPAVSEVLASSVRVLAINVRDPGATGALASMVTGSGGVPSTITVEVSDEMAQKLRLAEKLGSLSLSLRSVKDKDSDQVPVPSGVGSLSHAYRIETGGAAPVRIIRGVSAERTGGGNNAASQPAAGGPLPGLLGGLLR